MVKSGFYSYPIRFEDEIFLKIKSLENNFEIYPVDKYKKYNDGSYYAFEFESYRVSYRVKDSVIRILRIRHTSRKPINY